MKRQKYSWKNLRSIGVSAMHQSECIVVLAEGGFKINNGPPKNGKGPMSNEKDQGKSNEASLPKPTRAGRIETCTELIRQVTKCLENNDKKCTMRKIEELIKANCHDGRLIGKVVADKVKDVVHELWLISDSDEVCGLLIKLRSLNISKGWIRKTLGLNSKDLNKQLVKCGINWESRATKHEVVKKIEDLLREKFGWDEIKMCEALLKYIGVDVNEFRKYSVEPCSWLVGLETLSDLRRPYWLGMAKSDLMVGKLDNKIRLILKTTNAIDAIFFVKILNIIKTPSLVIDRESRAPTAKYVFAPINLSYFIYLGINAWPWSIELSAYELKKVLNSFSDEEFAEFVAGEIDGDGAVIYYYNDESESESVFVYITACKDCPKRYTLEVLKEIIAERFGIIGTINQLETDDALVFCGKNAVKLLRRIIKYMHHPIRRLRAELILAYYDGKISREELMKLYKPTKYKRGVPDVKRNNALEALVRAAPQTHTHGVNDRNKVLGGPTGNHVIINFYYVRPQWT